MFAYLQGTGSSRIYLLDLASVLGMGLRSRMMFAPFTVQQRSKQISR